MFEGHAVVLDGIEGVGVAPFPHVLGDSSDVGLGGLVLFNESQEEVHVGIVIPTTTRRHSEKMYSD